jgi:hypothetical protein
MTERTFRDWWLVLRAEAQLGNGARFWTAYADYLTAMNRVSYLRELLFGMSRATAEEITGLRAELQAARERITQLEDERKEADEVGSSRIVRGDHHLCDDRAGGVPT